MTAPSPQPTLRPVSAEDAEFLFSVYASTRTEELANFGWDATQTEQFLRSQFEAQRRWYEGEYPGAQFRIILVAGQPAGRLYVHERPDETRIMDIALLPEFRRRGIGTGLLQNMLAHGERTRRRVTIHVEVFNPAIRLYQRLGFRNVNLNGVYYLMEWLPVTGADIDKRSAGEAETSNVAACVCGGSSPMLTEDSSIKL